MDARERNVLTEISRRCLAEAPFREEFFRDPRAALRAVGLAVPEGTSVRDFCEQAGVSFPWDSRELSEAELGSVAGGDEPVGPRHSTADLAGLADMAYDPRFTGG